MIAIALVCYVLTTGTAQEKNGEPGTSASDHTGPTQSREAGKTHAFVSEAYSWYQSDKVRVFFSADFAQALGPAGVRADYDKEFQGTLGRLFRSGALSGEMFYRAAGDLPAAVSNFSRSDVEQSARPDVFRSMESYSGPLIKILRYEISFRSETHFETITYDLWVTSSLSETGWGEFDVFRITTKRRPVLGPKLVKFEYLGHQI